jgi:hypothetical protein
MLAEDAVMTTPSTRAHDTTRSTNRAGLGADPLNETSEKLDVPKSSQGCEGDALGDISLSNVMGEYKDAALDMMRLAELESRVAVQSAIRSVGLICAISVLSVTAWITLIASLSVWVWQAGFSLPVVLLTVSLLFTLSACLLYVAFKRTVVRVSLANTVEVLFGTSQLRGGENAD